MTVKQMIKYAEQKGYTFNGEKDYRDFYKAHKGDGSFVSSPTLVGLKNMIDRYADK